MSINISEIDTRTFIVFSSETDFEKIISWFEEQKFPIIYHHNDTSSVFIQNEKGQQELYQARMLCILDYDNITDFLLTWK